MKRTYSFYFLCLFAFLPFLTHAQTFSHPLSAVEKAEVLDSLTKRIQKLYVFPEMANKMTKQLKENYAKGNYTAITNPNAFADRLTKDLIAVCHDGHLAIRCDPNWVKNSSMKKSKAEMEAMEKNYLAIAKSQNYGFKELKILEGNIGYLNLSGFEDAAIGGPTAVAAMNFLSNTNAIIIDVRHNGGGSPSMVQLIASYFFDGEDRHLSTSYDRSTDVYKQIRTLPYVEGKRLPDVDVYVLTSNRTFSAPEDFCYSLQNLKRITVVGETTGGGAHGIEYYAVTDRFMVYMPIARSISPVTKTDWEGTGVVPDIKVPAKDALLTAHIKALERLSVKDPQNSKVKWGLYALRAKQQPVIVLPSVLQSYAGTYGERSITMENDKLYFEWRAGEKYPLMAVAPDEFQIEEMPYFQIKIIQEGGKVVGLSRSYDDGRSFVDPKNK